MSKKNPSADPVKAYLASIGKKGGQARTQAKKDAAKQRKTAGRPKGAKDKHPRKKKYYTE